MAEVGELLVKVSETATNGRWAVQGLDGSRHDILYHNKSDLSIGNIWEIQSDCISILDTMYPALKHQAEISLYLEGQKICDGQIGFASGRLTGHDRVVTSVT